MIVKNKLHFLSNINISKKILIVFILIFLSSILLFLGTFKIILNSEEKYQSENENTILNSTEQYISASIENVVSIAKTIYTNNSIYSLLNKEYQTSAEYYDAFYQLQNNNSLIIAENQNVKNYTVYSDNPTILNGGNICRLSDVKSQDWYKRFCELDKSMIFYCDNQNQNFSLIRKLDYYTVTTGSCYLKIDLNTKIIDDYFNNLDFSGSLYVISGGVLIFSNTDEKTVDDINITPEYKCYVKNYYTSELEYYAREKNHSFFEIISSNISYFLPFIILFSISLILAVLVSADIVFRTKKFSKILRSDSLLAKTENSYGGKDELGRIFSNCINLFDRLQFQQREYKKSCDALNKSYDNSKRLLIQALNLDVKNVCIKKYPIENPDLDFSSPVPINLEFDMLKKHLVNKNLNADISIEPMPEYISVLPFSVIMIADDLSPSGNEKLSISASLKNNSLSILFTSSADVSSGKILKLRAIFEDYPHQTDFDFSPGFYYNRYMRIKNYYGSNVNISISSDENFSLNLIYYIPEKR